MLELGTKVHDDKYIVPNRDQKFLFQVDKPGVMCFQMTFSCYRLAKLPFYELS